MLQTIQDDVRQAGEETAEAGKPTPHVVETLHHGLSDEVLDKLEKSTANEAQRQLVRDFSHETRGFFTILKGYMELIEESMEEESGSERFEMVEKVRSQLEKFASYVNQFIEIMRSEIAPGQTIITPTIESKSAPTGKTMTEIMKQVSQVFKGVLFDNKLSVDINVEPNLVIPEEVGPKVRLTLISLISHVAKVIQESHMVIQAYKRGRNLSIRCECYMTDDGYDLAKIIESGCMDIPRILKDLDGSMKVSSINKNQANIEFLIPID